MSLEERSRQALCVLSKCFKKILTYYRSSSPESNADGHIYTTLASKLGSGRYYELLSLDVIERARMWHVKNKIISSVQDEEMMGWETLTDLYLLANMVGYQDLREQVMRSVYSKLQKQGFPHEDVTYIYNRTIKGYEIRQAILDHAVYKTTPLQDSLEYPYDFVFDCLKGTQQYCLEIEMTDDKHEVEVEDDWIPYFTSLNAMELFASFDDEDGDRQEDGAISDQMMKFSLADDDCLENIQAKLFQYLTQVILLFWGKQLSQAVNFRQRREPEDQQQSEPEDMVE